MADEIPIEFPDDIKVRIEEIAAKTGCSYDQVVNNLMRSFFELVDNAEEGDVPSFVRRVRRALQNESGAG